MITDLTPEDKLVVVEQHMKNLLYSEYNLKMNLLEAQANGEASQGNIDAIKAKYKMRKETEELLQSFIKQ